MKKISEFIKSLGFTFSFRRLRKAIILVILFILIGTSVFLSLSYKNSETWLKKVYSKDVAKLYDLNGKKVVDIYKQDLNGDDKLDYVYIAADEIKEESDTSSSSTVEQYENLMLVFIDGKTELATVYETNKKFSAQVNLRIYDDEQDTYYMVSDDSGNVVLCKLNTENEQDINDIKFIDIVANTSSDFLGYTIYTKKSDDGTKLSVTLDNYNKSYLDEYSEDTVLDFTENGIDISRYRETYLRDKFSSFELKDTNNDGILEFVGYQYLLYSLDESENKTLGIVKTIFTIDNENKLKYSHTQVSII